MTLVAALRAMRLQILHCSSEVLGRAQVASQGRKESGPLRAFAPIAAPK